MCRLISFAVLPTDAVPSSSQVCVASPAFFAHTTVSASWYNHSAVCVDLLHHVAAQYLPCVCLHLCTSQLYGWLHDTQVHLCLCNPGCGFLHQTIHQSMRAGHVDMRARYCCHFTVRDHYHPPMPVLMSPTSSKQYCAYRCITGWYVFFPHCMTLCRDTIFITITLFLLCRLQDELTRINLVTRPSSIVLTDVSLAQYCISCQGS